MRRGILLASLLAVLSLTAGPVDAAGMTTSQTKIVKPYKITLVIGPAEAMSMKGQKGGEMMMGGQAARCTFKSGMGGMISLKGSRVCNHHVEVHVADAASGKVVTNAMVSVTMINTVRKRVRIHVPIAMMTGGSQADFHYGNNVHAASGPYTITVTVNRVAATFMMSLSS